MSWGKNVFQPKLWGVWPFWDCQKDSSSVQGTDDRVQRTFRGRTAPWSTLKSTGKKQETVVGLRKWDLISMFLIPKLLKGGFRSPRDEGSLDSRDVISGQSRPWGFYSVVNYACLWDIRGAYFDVKERGFRWGFPWLKLLCFGVVHFPVDLATTLCSQMQSPQYICHGRDSQGDARAQGTACSPVGWEAVHAEKLMQSLKYGNKLHLLHKPSSSQPCCFLRSASETANRSKKLQVLSKACICHHF